MMARHMLAAAETAEAAEAMVALSSGCVETWLCGASLEEEGEVHHDNEWVEVEENDVDMNP